VTEFYRSLVDLVGGAVVLLRVAAATTTGVGRDVFFFTFLGTLAGWLRFKLPADGYFSLTPVVFFSSVLILESPAPFVVAVASAFFAAVLFEKRGWRASLRRTGEEGLAALFALLVFRTASPSASPNDVETTISAYVLALFAYVAGRIGLGIVVSRANEGIPARSYLTSASPYAVANITLLAVIALVIHLSLYSQFGYLALALATVALVELYHPWKLLSEQDEILFANLAMVAQAIDIKDPYTARHSRNVAEIAVRLARTMRLPEGEVRKIRIGALMHDIGKIGVSSSIIRKPSSLEPAEASAMRKHPVISADIMQPIELLADAAEIVRHHHEYFDGSGYPSGLRGDEIPMGSRVILVADAFDAMTTDRPYRRGRSKAEAARVLREHAGRQFDPTVVQALEQIVHSL